MLGIKDIFSIKIIKYSLPDWENKKPKFIQMIDDSDSKWYECDTDYFISKGRSPYFDEWYSILKDDFDILLPRLDYRSEVQTSGNFGRRHTIKVITTPSIIMD